MSNKLYAEFVMVKEAKENIYYYIRTQRLNLNTFVFMDYLN
jgi:hypothetical protein